jgi:hypothetical protein
VTQAIAKRENQYNKKNVSPVAEAFAPAAGETVFGGS